MRCDTFCVRQRCKNHHYTNYRYALTTAIQALLTSNS